ncbi:YrdB family protein [Pseudarthrobacter sp. J1738]|uniref:YrdB family protein n=1 Tax=Pseudarthrobacter sp. J1738 TaxID=3420446 RepID=UPI003D2BC96D
MEQRRRRQRNTLVLQLKPLDVFHAVLSFVLEVAMLAASGFSMIRLVPGPWGIVLGLVVAAIVVSVWGGFLAPKARRRLSWPLLPVATLGLFLVAALLLLLASLPVLALVMTILAVVHVALGFYLYRRAH